MIGWLNVPINRVASCQQLYQDVKVGGARVEPGHPRSRVAHRLVRQPRRDGVYRKLDDRGEAHLIALACTPRPCGATIGLILLGRWWNSVAPSLSHDVWSN